MNNNPADCRIILLFFAIVCLYFVLSNKEHYLYVLLGQLMN
jgi:hypothetical protein